MRYEAKCQKHSFCFSSCGTLYFWLKTNYHVYLCRLEFLTTPAFSWAQALPRSPLKSPRSLVRHRKSRWRLSRRRCRSSLSQRFSKFQPSRNDQANFLSLKMPLARLIDVSKVVNRNHHPCNLFIFLLSVSLALLFRECHIYYQTCIDTRWTHMYM